MTTSRYKVRFPGESESYRTARDKLLDAEVEMRRTVESVARSERVRSPRRQDLPLLLLLFAPADPGQDGRHVDMIWPLWNLFDFTPEGRGQKWSPKLTY